MIRANEQNKFMRTTHWGPRLVFYFIQQHSRLGIWIKMRYYFVFKEPEKTFLIVVWLLLKFQKFDLYTRENLMKSVITKIQSKVLHNTKLSWFLYPNRSQKSNYLYKFLGNTVSHFIDYSLQDQSLKFLKKIISSNWLKSQFSRKFKRWYCSK